MGELYLWDITVLGVGDAGRRTQDALLLDSPLYLVKVHRHTSYSTPYSTPYAHCAAIATIEIPTFGSNNQ